ncbi:MAG TPA: adenylate kinase [Acidobacteriota bacterium]|nr:adenylate kinase [Acidobacteriota bacterium]
MKNGRLAIIMLGPPGAGKGTQARMIGEALGFPHVSTGDMLRESLKNGTELGKKAKAFMESGGLVPDDLVDAIVAERLAREDCNRGFILDGYPRTIPQARFLEALFEKSGTRILSIGVEVGDDVLIRRLSSRWTCPTCGKMFNAASDPGKAGGQCDECGTVLVQRKDDTAEVIAERLHVYHTKTKPLVRHYQEQGSYSEINGERAVEEIFGSIMHKIMNHE